MSFLVSFGPIDNVAVTGEHHIHLFGCPSLFGRGAEEAEALISAGIPYEVVPGVTAAFAAAKASINRSRGCSIEIGPLGL